MDSDNSVADRHAVEPYIGNTRWKVTNGSGLLFAGLGKHLPEKLWIGSAPIVSPNAGPSADLAAAVEQRGFRGGGALILQVIRDVHAPHESESQYACSSAISAGDDAVLKSGSEERRRPAKVQKFCRWGLLKSGKRHSGSVERERSFSKQA
jgi:hypothetical protein